MCTQVIFACDVIVNFIGLALQNLFLEKDDNTCLTGTQEIFNLIFQFKLLN